MLAWRDMRGSATGPNRAAERYYQENATPPQRYVTTHQGTTQYRLWPHESGLADLVLAGDWTRNGIDGAAWRPRWPPGAWRPMP